METDSASRTDEDRTAKNGIRSAATGESPRSPERSPRRSLLWSIPALLSVVTVLIGAWWLLDLPRDPAAVMETLVRALEGLPAPVGFAAIVLVPTFFLPVSPLYVFVGPQLGLPLLLLAVGVNIVIGYPIGRYLLRGFLEKLLLRMGYPVPRIPDEQNLTFMAMIRINPAVALPIQNYLLGMAGVPFLPYLAVSWPIQGGFAAGFYFLGEGLFAGNLKYVLLGVALVLLVVFLRRMATRRKDRSG